MLRRPFSRGAEAATVGHKSAGVHSAPYHERLPSALPPETGVRKWIVGAGDFIVGEVCIKHERVPNMGRRHSPVAGNGLGRNLGV